MWFKGPYAWMLAAKGKLFFIQLAAGSKIFYTSTFVPIERSTGAFT
jgi:hypothetical protein